MKRWITAATVSLAALLALPACGGPVAPAPDSSQASASDPSGTTATSTISSISSKEGTSGTAAPTEATAVGIGGEASSYDMFYINDFKTPSQISDLVDTDMFVAWATGIVDQLGRDNQETYLTLSPVGFVQEFNISKEAFTQANFSVPKYAVFTQEEIDIIYSFDLTRINAHFGNPDAVILGEDIYPLVWFEKNPVEEWAARDIPAQMVEEAFQRLSPILLDGTKNLLQGKIDAYKAM